MHKIDWPVFAAAVTCLCAATLPLAIAPDASASVIQSTYRWVAQALGPLYLWAGTLTFFFVAYLALSRHGRVVLGPGPPDPEFDNFSWFSMLFCAGIASGLLYWGVIEWAYYYQSPPLRRRSRLADRPRMGHQLSTLPLGLHRLEFLRTPTVAIAYACHRRGEGSYRLSAACRPLLGSQTDGFLGRAIDVFFIVGILGGAGTSLGLSTPMLAEGTAQLFGWVRSYTLDVAIVLGCAVIFSISVYIGLERGIRILSNANLVLSLGLIALVLVAGDTLFILKASTSSIGHVLQNFFQMNL